MILQFDLSDSVKSELKTLIHDSLKQELHVLFSSKQGKNESNDQLLNRKQACKLLGCSLTTLYHYQRKGLIPFHKVGRKVLFNRSAILEHLKVNAEI